jgi:hypothetical protein
VSEVRGGDFDFSIENPRGLLRKRPFMDTQRWPKNLQAELLTCDYCAFGAPYRKTTNFWTSLKGWVPRGNTGDGRCHHECGQGGWVAGEGERRYFRHHVALANESIDGLRGEGATQTLNHIPSLLCSEMLQASKKGKRGRRVLLDLCAGYQSMRESALAMGWDYIAVDIRHLRDSRSKSS